MFKSLRDGNLLGLATGFNLALCHLTSAESMTSAEFLMPTKTPLSAEVQPDPHIPEKKCEYPLKPSVTSPHAIATNQMLINELVGFVNMILPNYDNDKKYLFVDRISKTILGADLTALTNHRKDPAKPEYVELIRKLTTGEDYFDQTSKKPVLLPLSVMHGEYNLRPGQTDVLGLLAPLVSQSLGLSLRFSLDPEFEKALRTFQGKNALAISGDINQETLIKLIELGKLHCSAHPFEFVRSNEIIPTTIFSRYFELQPDSAFGSREQWKAVQAQNVEGKYFLEQLRVGLALPADGGFDGALEATIIRFRLNNMPTTSPHGEITSDLISEMHKRKLIQLYVVKEDPINYSLTFSNGLLPRDEKSILTIAQQLFSRDRQDSRETELALHTSGSYQEFLKLLSDIYRKSGDKAGEEKVTLMLKALEIHIDFPARIICSSDGKIDALKSILLECAKFDPERATYLILTPEADHNAVFDGCVPEVQTDSLTVNLVYDDINSTLQLTQNMDRATACRQTKIQLLISAAHGAEDGISLGLKSYQDRPDVDKDKRELNEQFDFANCRNNFDSGAVWIFNSCLTANDSKSPQNSFAYLVSKLLPDIYIIAYRESVFSPKAFVVSSIEEVEKKLKTLPPNSRYAKIPGGNFLITSSSFGEVPVVIKGGQLVKDFLLSDLSRAPDKIDDLNNRFRQFTQWNPFGTLYDWERPLPFYQKR